VAASERQLHRNVKPSWRDFCFFSYNSSSKVGYRCMMMWLSLLTVLGFIRKVLNEVDGSSQCWPLNFLQNTCFCRPGFVHSSNLNNIFWETYKLLLLQSIKCNCLIGIAKIKLKPSTAELGLAQGLNTGPNWFGCEKNQNTSTCKTHKIYSYTLSCI